jgi:hypothetical protein
LAEPPSQSALPVSLLVLSLPHSLPEPQLPAVVPPMVSPLLEPLAAALLPQSPALPLPVAERSLSPWRPSPLSQSAVP